MITQWFYDSSVQRFHGLSTDTKPTGCTNGSVFIEINTGTIYMYNAAAGTWGAVPNPSDYTNLTNKPSINGVTLVGDKSLADLGIVSPMMLKGRVDTVADLDNIQNPQTGWVYFVGSSGATELEEYVYIESGSWQFLGYNSIVIDSSLSTTSENPVQNKVITNAMVGEKTTCKQYTIDGQTVTAADGAEIFNDYVGNKAAGQYSHAEGSSTSAIGNQQRVLVSRFVVATVATAVLPVFVVFACIAPLRHQTGTLGLRRFINET